MGTKSNLLSKMELADPDKDQTDEENLDDDSSLSSSENRLLNKDHFLVSIYYGEKSSPDMFIVHRRQLLNLLKEIQKAQLSGKSNSMILSDQENPETDDLDKYVEDFRGMILISPNIRTVRIMSTDNFQ